MIPIGNFQLDSILALAPMAGVSDLPFRTLCRNHGANWTPSEMVTSQPQLRNTRKSQWRLSYQGEPAPIIVQIAGADPKQLAESAIFHEQNGAHIIDINMGCPAKKVCNVAAGSALLANEALVADILAHVVRAVTIPVTLKIRTGSTHEDKNAVTVARIAQDTGIQLLTIHGRTRADKFLGHAEYDTIANVKQSVEIPIIANGDIDSGKKAHDVLQHTNADGLMIGRAAQGNPWIFKEIEHYLKHGETLAKPSLHDIHQTMLSHISAIHEFYGDYMGVRIARKHIGWWFLAHPMLAPHFKQAKAALFSAKDPLIQQRLIDEQLTLISHSSSQTLTTSKLNTQLNKAEVA